MAPRQLSIYNGARSYTIRGSQFIWLRLWPCERRLFLSFCFILFVTALYVFQNTVVMPTVENIAKSDFFFENHP